MIDDDLKNHIHNSVKKSISDAVYGITSDDQEELDDDQEDTSEEELDDDQEDTSEE